ncbi:hypothetical protein OEG84_18035 [Hoeflea sp. G2-23]|uniref:Sel1 repeat family protein n=1 Tax=Hoeflea algicola TaxID=2983763 RepID=A0ABT3ZD28_9HYPH|nr:hypothetical protein [Hoeflea algicola]MCY0149553.1 hypothetical protein [Hoeflea algicola]
MFRKACIFSLLALGVMSVSSEAKAQAAVDTCLSQSGVDVKTRSLAKGSGPLDSCRLALRQSPKNDHVKFAFLRLLAWNQEYSELKRVASELGASGNASALFWMGVVYHRGYAGTAVDFDKARTNYAAAQRRSGQLRDANPSIRRTLRDNAYGSAQYNLRQIQY